MRPQTAPFQVRDCELVMLSTGLRAQNLRELRDTIARVHCSSLYHHFWGRLLEPTFLEPEFNNDFASWAFHGLHDLALAEQLSALHPGDIGDLEDLRQELLEVVEMHLDEHEYVPWSKGDQQFHFVRAQIVVFRSHHRARTPDDLGALMPSLTEGSIYYHFIDGRRREPQGVDDFTQWLATFGDVTLPLRREILAIDPYFSTLHATREELAAVFQRCLGEGVA